MIVLHRTPGFLYEALGVSALTSLLEIDIIISNTISKENIVYTGKDQNEERSRPALANSTFLQ